MIVHALSALALIAASAGQAAAPPPPEPPEPPSPPLAPSIQEVHRMRLGDEAAKENPLRYEAGSIAKFACTIAILRLYDQEKLSLDDQVGDLVPALKNMPAASVALRHVLAYRSGIADGFRAAARADVGAVMAISDPAEAAARFANGPLDAEPGAQWSYDLVNWMIAQAVIEEVTGDPLETALARLVLEPAGMKHSYVFAGTGGEYIAKPLLPSRPLPRYMQCAGGLASVPDDLVKLVQFPHRGGLGAASVYELTNVTTPEEAYTLGGRFRTNAKGQLISWQTGSNGSYRALALYQVAGPNAVATMNSTAHEEFINEYKAKFLAGF